MCGQDFPKNDVIRLKVVGVWGFHEAYSFTHAQIGWKFVGKTLVLFCSYLFISLCCSLKFLGICFFFFEANVMVILWPWFLKVHSFVSLMQCMWWSSSSCSTRDHDVHLLFYSVIDVFLLLIILVLVSWW